LFVEAGGAGPKSGPSANHHDSERRELLPDCARAIVATSDRVVASKLLRRVQCKGVGMKRIASLAAAVLVTSGLTFAQTSGSAQTSTSTSATSQAPSDTTQASTSANATTNSGGLAEGTAITAELTKGLDSKKAKQGDPVQAKVVQDVIATGKLVIPRNSKLIGHVTEVKAGGKGEASSLGIAFDKAVLKSGQEIPIHAVIQALAPPPRFANPNAPSPGMSDDTGMTAAPQGGYSADSPAARPMPSGPMGGATSTVGGVAGSATGATNSVGTTATNTAGTATNTVGMTSNGQLTAGSRGVMGMPGVTLNAGATNASSGSVVTNDKKNVKLDSGTQVVLRVTAQ
jgi:hypothetical protein